jgi:hypothetical protein
VLHNWGGRKPSKLRLYGGISLHIPSAFHGFQHRDLIGILDLAANMLNQLPIRTPGRLAPFDTTDSGR